MGFSMKSFTRVLFAALFMAAGAVAHAQDASLHDVYQAVQAGRYTEAQGMMDKVLRDHPQSAKAHYVEAEILAKQGRYAEAKAELGVARRINPALDFAKPQAVRELEGLVERDAAVSSSTADAADTAQAAPHASAGGISWGLIVAVLVLGVLAFVIIRAVTRSRNSGYDGAPTRYYGGAAPSPYSPPGSPPPYAPPGAPGVGSGILGSLATGAALGAGVVAGEELMHHFTDGNGGVREANAAQPEQQPAPYDDLGGQDFGVADNSSWDDSSSSDSGGGGDWS